MKVELRLPYPPSVNRYYRHVGAKVLISREGRGYRERVAGIVRAERLVPFARPVAVCIKAFPPDRRRRDLDNILKALLDALVHGGAMEDDSLIRDLRVRMMTWCALPSVEVVIEDIEDGREQERG